MAKKIFLIFVALLGACVLFVPILSRLFLTRYALHKAQDLLQMKLDLASAELHPLEGGVVLRGLKVYHPDRPEEKVIEVDRADIRIRPLSLMFGGLAGFELTMDHPRLIYATTKSGDWELSKKIPLLRRGEGEKRLPVNIDQIKMKDGEVEYRDGKVGLTTRLSEIEIDVRHVRLPQKDDPLPAEFDMSFKINREAKFKMNGRADFLSPKISFDSNAHLQSLSLPPFAPYYDHGLPVRITHGSLGMNSHAQCQQDMLNAPAHAAIGGLRVEPKQAKIFGFASDIVVDALKDRNGAFEFDLLVNGNIRNPQFHVMTDLTAGFIKELSHGLIMAVPNKIGDTLKGVGEGAQHGAESGLGKLKKLFH